MKGIFYKNLHALVATLIAGVALQSCSPAVTAPPVSGTSSTTTVVETGEEVDTDAIELTSISPSSQIIGGTIILKGKGLTHVAGILINDVSIEDFFIISSKAVIAILPSGVSSGDVMIFDLDGNFSLLESSFTLLGSGGGSSSSSSNFLDKTWFGQPGQYCDTGSSEPGQSKLSVYYVDFDKQLSYDGTATFTSNTDCSGTPDSIVFSESEPMSFISAEIMSMSGLGDEYKVLKASFESKGHTVYVGEVFRETGDEDYYDFVLLQADDHSWVGDTWQEWKDYYANTLASNALVDFETSDIGKAPEGIRRYPGIAGAQPSSSPSPSDSASSSPSPSTSNTSLLVGLLGSQSSGLLELKVSQTGIWAPAPPLWGGYLDNQDSNYYLGLFNFTLYKGWTDFGTEGALNLSSLNTGLTYSNDYWIGSGLHLDNTNETEWFASKNSGTVNGSGQTIYYPMLIRTTASGGISGSFPAYTELTNYPRISATPLAIYDGTEVDAAATNMILSLNSYDQGFEFIMVNPNTRAVVPTFGNNGLLSSIRSYWKYCKIGSSTYAFTAEGWRNINNGAIEVSTVGIDWNTAPNTLLISPDTCDVYLIDNSNTSTTSAYFSVKKILFATGEYDTNFNSTGTLNAPVLDGYGTSGYILSWYGFVYQDSNTGNDWINLLVSTGSNSSDSKTYGLRFTPAGSVSTNRLSYNNGANALVSVAFRRFNQSSVNFCGQFEQPDEGIASFYNYSCSYLDFSAIAP